MQTSQLDQVRPEGEKVVEVEETAQTFPIGSPRTEAKSAAVRQEASRPLASIPDVAKATAKTWATTSLLEAFNSPQFQTQADFDVVGRLNELPFAPTAEEERILRKTNSDEAFNYQVERIEELREAYRTMGDRPGVAFVAGIVDPVYVAADALTLRTASALRAGRLAASSAAGAGTAAIGAVEYQHAPIEFKEIVLGALLNTAAVGALHRTQRSTVPGTNREIEKLTRELTGAANKAVDEVDLPVQRSIEGRGLVVETPNPSKVTDSVKGATQVPKVINETSTMVKQGTRRTPVEGSVPLREVIDRTLAARTGTHATITVNNLRKLSSKLGDALDDIRVVRNANVNRSHYDLATDTIHLKRGENSNILAHEVAHAATAYKLRYGRLNPNTVHGGIARELDDIRKMALKSLKDDPDLTPDMAYYLGKTSSPEKALDEFVAGLFSGDTKFLKALAKLEDTRSPIPGTTVLKSMWDSVRRILGLDPAEANLLQRAVGLTDELLDTPAPRYSADPDVQFLHGPPSSVAPTTATEIAAEVNKQMDSLGVRFGKWTAWNLHKLMAKFDPEIADILVSDPLNPSINSASSIKRAIKADLQRQQFEFEDMFKQEMAERGYGTKEYLTNKNTMRAQSELSKEVARVLAQRENAQRLGITRRADPDNPIEKLAQKHQEVMEAAAKIESSSGVYGAEGLTSLDGYFRRSWNPTTLADMDAKFATLGAEGKEELAKQLSRAIRTEGLDEAERVIMAKAILDRTRLAGDMSDNMFRGHLGNSTVLEVEDYLRRNGLKEENIESVTDLLTGRVEEAGKASRFKSRMDIDMTATIRAPDGTVYEVADMLDTDLLRMMEVRLDEASGSAALAQKGLRTTVEVEEMRSRFISKGVDAREKQELATLFDDSINALMGRQVGEAMSRAMRVMSAVTQMVGLAYSGLWQVTEYAKMMQRYGVLRTGREIIRELPGFRQVLDEDAAGLNKVLAENSFQDIRIRPFLSRLEDNFDINSKDRLLQVAHHAKQFVPYINGMAYVHRHQARVAGNLIMDSVNKAAQGNVQAQRALRKYGISGPDADELYSTVRSKGTNTAEWPDGVWEKFRDPLTRMIDDDVLRSKLGEIPAFAQFSTLGKFIFTFRSFVLGAHNKILANTLVNEGEGALALMLAYQLPLTMLATQSANMMRGEGFITDTKEWAEKSIGQMGGLGLFADLSGVILGNKDQFGSPGMIAIDKAFRMTNNVFQGDWGDAAKNAISATPLLGIMPGANAIHKLWE